ELPRVLKLQPAGSSYTPLKNSTAFAANVDTNTLRSRNRLPFSQEVSGAKRHAWQQAPCTDLPPSYGSCSAQRGSEAQIRNDSSICEIWRPRLSGCPKLTRPPNVPSLSVAAV